MQTVQLHVSGMSSPGCALVLVQALKEMGGVRGVTVSYTASEATVEYDEKLTSPAKLRLAVTGAGYQATAPAT